jgi:nitroreductase
MLKSNGIGWNMNETLRVIENRKSTRNFSDTPISQEEKESILHACMRAPTAGNMMLYSIIDVEDQAIKDQLADSCDDQPFIAKAPMVLLFLADYQRWMDLYAFSEVEKACQEKGIPPRTPAEGDLLLACCDALIAAQTAVIAAESLGIGSCYIGDILEQAEFHRELFKLPQYTLPITLLVFGRPAVVKEEKRLIQRFPAETVIYKDGYRRAVNADFIKMYQETAERQHPEVPLDEAVKNIGRNNYFRKFVSDFSIEMSRSSAVWLDTWKNGVK